jgi:hypothetical protein
MSFWKKLFGVKEPPKADIAGKASTQPTAPSSPQPPSIPPSTAKSPQTTPPLAQVTATSDEINSFCEAVGECDLRRVKALTESKPTLVFSKDLYTSALQAAVAHQKKKKEDWIPLIRFLLEHGADVDVRSNRGTNGTLLMDATYEADEDLMLVLLEYAADPNAVDNEEETPFGRVGSWEDRHGEDWYLRHRGKQVHDLMVKRGGKWPLVDPCTECGSPNMREMATRGLEFVPYGDVNAVFECPACHATLKVSVQLLDKNRGIQVICDTCNKVAFIPPSVWCRKCGVGLSTGWQKGITR